MKKKIFILTILTSVVFALFSTGATVTAEEPTERYGRSTATGNVAYAYDIIMEGVMAENPSEKIEFSSEKSLTLEELRCAYTLFSSDFPECFWLGSNYSYSQLQNSSTVVAIEPNYAFSGDELTEAKAEMRKAINTVMEDIPTDSDYAKALYLHDALARETKYRMVGEHQTAYGALVSKKAVCAGYAAAYQLLLQEAGICAWTVNGVSYDPASGEQVPHAWNVVWIDGECLYTDVTWDDQGDELYHSYFNLALSEIETDHIVNSDIFALPECNHFDKGYFHKNGNIITDSTTPQEAAKMFDTTQNGIRTAEVLYGGNSDFSEWINDNFEALYFAIGGKSSPDASYAITKLGKEVHISIVGELPIMTHRVTVNLGKNMTYAGNLEQEVTVGESIGEIVLTANANFYFPITYSTLNTDGITVERLSYTTVKIYGAPEKSVTITLDSASKKEMLKTPSASFIATGEDSGMLSGLDEDAKYSTDGGASWTKAAYDSVIIESGVDAQFDILVINSGDDVTTLDSEIQTIDVTQAELVYTAIAHSETSAGGDGRISGLSPLMEYKSEAGSWAGCDSNEITALSPGNYLIRMRASDTCLASKSLTVTVPSHTDVSVSGVKIEIPNEFFLGDVNELQIELYPRDSKNQTVYYSGNNPEYILVDPLTGKLTCIARGVAKITVTTQNGGFSDTVEIKVSCKHTETETAKNNLPTCREGEIYYECTLCGQVFDSQMNNLDGIPKSHLYSSEVKYDKNEHWHECACGERASVGKHSFGEWEKHSEQGEEVQQRICEVCGVKEIREIPISEMLLGFIKDNILSFILGAVAIVAAVTVISVVKKKKKKKN